MKVISQKKYKGGSSSGDGKKKEHKKTYYITPVDIALAKYPKRDVS